MRVNSFIPFIVRSGRFDRRGSRNDGCYTTLSDGCELDWAQSEGGTVDEEMVAKREELFRRSVRSSVEDYQELLELGMPPEDARFVLPIGTKVNLVMALNVRMLMHVADMQAAADSQWEARDSHFNRLICIDIFYTLINTILYFLLVK